MGAAKLEVKPAVGSGTYRFGRAEKRRTTRTAVDMPIRLDWGDESLPGRAVDCGMGGAFVRCNSIPAYGVEVSMVISDGDRELRFPAVVRWASDAGFGLQFLLLGAFETHYLASMLRKQP